MFELDSFVLLNPDGTIPWTANQDANGYLLQNLLDPVNPQDAATKAYVLAHGGSQTPWTSDIDTAGFKLLGLQEIDFKGAPSDVTIFPKIYAVGSGFGNNLYIEAPDSGTVYLGYAGGNSIDLRNNSFINVSQLQLISGLTLTEDEIDSSSANSSFYLTADSNFGIHNGEPAGVGADINFVSDNGAVIVSPRLGIGTTTPVYDIDIQSTDPSHSPFISLTYAQGGTGDFSCGLLFFNENGLNGAFSATAAGYSAGGFVPDQCVFQSRQSGGMLLTTYGGGPMVFAGASAAELARFDDATGSLFIGSDIDDGTGATVQITGSLSINGVLVTAP